MHKRVTQKTSELKMSNETKAHISASLYNVGFMFCTGAIVQTFLLQIGFSAQQVYFYNSIAQMAQVLMMIMMIFISPSIKKVKLVTGLSYMSLLALAVVLLITAVVPSISGNTLMLIIFGVTFFCFRTERKPHALQLKLSPNHP